MILIGIAILRTLEHRLYDPDPAELQAVLSGRSVVLPAVPSSEGPAPRPQTTTVVGQTEVDPDRALLTGGGRMYGVQEDKLFQAFIEGEGIWNGLSPPCFRALSSSQLLEELTSAFLCL